MACVVVSGRANDSELGLADRTPTRRARGTQCTQSQHGRLQRDSGGARPARSAETYAAGRERRDERAADTAGPAADADVCVAKARLSDRVQQSGVTSRIVRNPAKGIAGVCHLLLSRRLINCVSEGLIWRFLTKLREGKGRTPVFLETRLTVCLCIASLASMSCMVGRRSANWHCLRNRMLP